MIHDLRSPESRHIELLTMSHLTNVFIQISQILVRGHHLKVSLQQCTDVLRQELNLDIAAIWTYTTQLEQLELQGMAIDCEFEQNSLLSFQSNISQQEQVKTIFNCYYLPLANSLIGLVAQKLEPVYNLMFLTQEIETSLWCELPVNLWEKASVFTSVDPQLKSHQEEFIYFMGYPLLVDQHLVGFLGLWSDQPWSEQYHQYMTAIAQSMALAMDHDRVKTALLSRREALLFRLANQIRNSLDLDTILKNAVSEIRTLLDVDYCYYLWCWTQGDKNSVMISHESHLDSPQIKSISQCSATQLEVIGEKISQLQNIRLENIEYDALPFEQPEQQTKFVKFMKELELKAILLIPLKTRCDHLGAIACSDQSPRQWNVLEIELLQGVVDQLALAIDQAEAFAQASATALAAQTQAQQLQFTLQELKQAQAQLIQTEKMSSLGQMVAGIAHEINNPVNFITGNLNYTNDYIQDLLKLVELYREKIPEIDTEIEEFEEDIDLEFIKEDLPKTVVSMQVGANRIREIVLSLRNFSRLDEAEMKFADIHEGIDSTLLILQNRFKGKAGQVPIQLIKNYGEIPRIECYPGQLNQVLMNIISNSLDALSDNPEPCIIISTGIEKNSHAQELVLIKIKDNGSGIDQEHLKHIFDPFFTTKPVGKGTGLGLSISYQIVVDRHKGNIECLSELGKGTEFIISLPFIPDKSS